MRALALAFTLLLACCGGTTEPPKAFDAEVCELHCHTLCVAMIACGIKAGDIAPYAADAAVSRCYDGCAVGLTTVIYDRELDHEGLADYCNNNRKDTPNMSCDQLWSSS